MSAMIKSHSANRGKTICLMASNLALGVSMLTAPSPSLAQDSPARHPTEVRELWGKEYADAQQAADSADRLRAAFETRYSWHPSSQLKPSSEEAQKDAQKVIAAYAQVADAYPNSDVAARSSIRLAGFYQYLGQTGKAIDTAKETASVYENTQYAPKAAFEVGLLYLQAAHNPTAAMEWFQKVPKPPRDNVTDPKDFDQNEELYLAAQEQLAKCALTMGQREVAQDRFTRLAEQYPLYRDAIRREQEIQGKTALHPDLRLADDIIEQSVASLDVSASPPAAADNVVRVASPVIADAPVMLPGKNSTWRCWAGGSMLLVGIGLCALGTICYRRTPDRKGDVR